jgi:hypothetical protein
MFKAIAIITITICCLISIAGNYYKLANVGNDGKIVIGMVQK